MAQKTRKIQKKKGRKKSEFRRKIDKCIPYIIVALFTYTLYSTQFFHLFYLNQGESYEENPDRRLLTVYDFSTPRDVMEIVLNFQEYFQDILTEVDIEQMYSFLNDGLAFIGRTKDPQNNINTEPGTYKYNFTKSQDNLTTENPHSTPISDKPLVYMMNTHTTEWFESERINSELGRVLNVQDVSYMMAEYFENYGINTIVENRDVGDLVRERQWQYYRSYEASRVFLEETAKQYESLQFFFDIHRDSLERQWTTIEIDGKSYAKIILIIGAEHENYRQNYAMADKIHQMLEEKYPGLSKGVMEKSGNGVNGVYNQDFAPTLLLFEIGGVDNTFEEVQNSAQALTSILAEYIQSQ